MTEQEREKICAIFKRYPAVKLGYLFGSRATGTSGPLSDYDFALYLEERDEAAMFDTKLRIQPDLAQALGTDRVDVVILNLAQSPELKYAVIAEGTLLYEVEPFRMLVEPRILNEYFDFHEMLKRHELTRG